MARRCEDVKCPWLAEDGTCLLAVEELPEKCPARETVHNEHKDTWINSESLTSEMVDKKE